MADHDTPAVADAADDAFECAIGVLIRMAGHARVPATKFLQRCTDEEILAFATCEDGPTFAQLMDQVLDRLERRLPVADAVVAPVESESPDVEDE